MRFEDLPNESVAAQESFGFPEILSLRLEAELWENCALGDADVQYLPAVHPDLLAVHPTFEGLKRAAMPQLAGLLVLATTGSRDLPGRSMLALAIEAHAEVSEMLSRVFAPRQAPRREERGESLTDL
jgi:hypothetical protein